MLPYIVAFVAIIACFFSYQMKLYADHMLADDYEDLNYAVEKFEVCRLVYNNLRYASSDFYIDKPVVYLKNIKDVAVITVHKKDGNKTNIKNLHFHLSSDEISAQWGYWNDDKKSVQCTIFPGKKRVRIL